MAIIGVDSLSFTSILNSLTNYFNSQADSEKFKDFYESSTGKLIVRFLSAFGSFISYMVTVARRENYITYAQNTTSLIGLAQNLGYSVSRGKNEIINMTVVPNMTGFIPANTVVGSVKGVDLVTVNEVSLNYGVSSTIQVYIGSLKTETLTVATSELTVFRFISTNVSDYISLYLNYNPNTTNTALPVSSYIRDLANDKYIAISNPLGAVDVMYLQAGNYNYSPTDTITLEYVELAQVSYTISDLLFDFGIVSSVSSVLPYIVSESNNNIVLNAPLYHETQVLIRGRNDYLKQFESLGYNLVSTNSNDFTSAIVELSYLSDDYTILNNIEKTNVLTSLDSMRAMGIPLPIFRDPRQVNLNLYFDIKTLPLNTV